jgi:hypothetical protein
LLWLLQVAPFYRDGLLWGFTVSFLKDGVSANDVRVAFDDEVVLKHEWVGRGAGALGGSRAAAVQVQAGIGYPAAGLMGTCHLSCGVFEHACVMPSTLPPMIEQQAGRCASARTRSERP